MGQDFSRVQIVEDIDPDQEGEPDCTPYIEYQKRRTDEMGKRFDENIRKNIKLFRDISDAASNSNTSRSNDDIIKLEQRVNDAIRKVWFYTLCDAFTKDLDPTKNALAISDIKEKTYGYWPNPSLRVLLRSPPGVNPPIDQDIVMFYNYSIFAKGVPSTGDISKDNAILLLEKKKGHFVIITIGLFAKIYYRQVEVAQPNMNSSGSVKLTLFIGLDEQDSFTDNILHLENVEDKNYISFKLKEMTRILPMTNVDEFTKLKRVNTSEDDAIIMSFEL
ncbi:Protein of unknown function [Pyronema omphalodes CBS 100304]|uniref:Uncharacterized protein n=1 Tax=Pyronema omphalodes (strain CBS 100304) TaxID=1076935 RepID=U4L8L7_PYROM|nr:Protein of unknown function [Pyronema omphalodes CBS 100304]